jgi:ketosteroid isomerase-like protein
MSVEANKQTAVKFLDAMQHKRWDVLVSMMTPDAVSWVPPSAQSVMGYPQSVQGARAIVEARARSSGERYSPHLEVTTTHLIGDGELVAAFITLRATTTDGQPYENDYVMLFRFVEGKIAEWGEYLDTAHAFLQFGLRITKP